VLGAVQLIKNGIGVTLKRLGNLSNALDPMPLIV
jgi:hypothetical protein